MPLRLNLVGNKPAHRVATHTKANAQGVKAERPDIRKVPKSEFDDVPGGMPELIERLFGPAPVGKGEATGVYAEIDEEEPADAEQT